MLSEVKISSVMCFFIYTFFCFRFFTLPLSLSLGTFPGSRNTGCIFCNHRPAVFLYLFWNLLLFPEPGSSGRRYHSGHICQRLYMASSEIPLMLLPFLSRYSYVLRYGLHENQDFRTSLLPLPWKSSHLASEARSPLLSMYQVPFFRHDSSSEPFPVSGRPGG